MQWVLEIGDCHILIQTAAVMTSPCPVHKHEHPLLLIGQSSVVLFAPSHCVYMPIYRARAAYGHHFFSVHTQNGQLADLEEIFAEFDKKCIGLESLTLLLILNEAFRKSVYFKFYSICYVAKTFTSTIYY